MTRVARVAPLRLRLIATDEHVASWLTVPRGVTIGVAVP